MYKHDVAGLPIKFLEIPTFRKMAKSLAVRNSNEEGQICLIQGVLDFGGTQFMVC